MLLTPAGLVGRIDEAKPMSDGIRIATDKYRAHKRDHRRCKTGQSCHQYQNPINSERRLVESSNFLNLLCDCRVFFHVIVKWR
jgi:hypothetical protein